MRHLWVTLLKARPFFSRDKKRQRKRCKLCCADQCPFGILKPGKVWANSFTARFRPHKQRDHGNSTQISPTAAATFTLTPVLAPATLACVLPLLLTRRTRRS